MNKEITAFDLVHETQITKLIERLPNKKSSGLDNISNILVKRLCYTIRIHITITIIYDKSLITATFHDMCKIAKVIPVHKRGNLLMTTIDQFPCCQFCLKF